MSIAGGIVLFLIALRMIFPREGPSVIGEPLEGEPFLSSTFFYRVLRERGLIAIERLMGMLLAMVAVQMLLNGLKRLLRSG